MYEYNNVHMYKSIMFCFQVLAYAIQKSDMDLRRMLYENIVLSGGSTLFKGE